MAKLITLIPEPVENAAVTPRAVEFGAVIAEVSKYAPTPEGTPGSAAESIPTAPDGISTAPGGDPESAPESIAAAPEGISAAPEGVPESAFEPIPTAQKGIPVSALEPFLDLFPVQEAVPVSPDTTTEAIPESYALPVKAMENISEQTFHPVTKVTVSEPHFLPREAIPASHVVPTELILASRVMPTESSPASCTMPTEIIPELLVLPVMASQATLEQPDVTVSAMNDTKAISVLPTSYVMTTEGDAVYQVVFSETVPASVTDACPER